ncbi:MAG TPA: hypothetical protein PLU50_05800 [Pseudobdellovibrionaceae bacterium]|nr:hypothetical protein [Pseudobdellovibrionaceae bacterium]
MRKFRYRPIMLTDHERAQLLDLCWSRFIRHARLVHKNKIHPAEFVSDILVQSTQIRCGHLTWNGRRLTNKTPMIDESNRLLDESQIHDKNLMANLQSLQLRGLPEQAQEMLLLWFHKKIDLLLTWDEPSVFQVLQMQAQGRRCVTIPPRARDFASVNCHGRDTHSFIIHDLMHAYFFFRTEYFDFQKNISKFFVENWNSTWLVAIKRSTSWPKFEYLLSDMNTHPEHWLATFQGLVHEVQLTELTEIAPKLFSEFPAQVP